MLVILFTVLSQFMSFCQEKKASGQKEQEKTQSLTPSQTATVKSILSKYNPSALTATDARAIHEKLRDAGLHAGPETRDVLVSAGFDPEKLKALDPPKNKEEGNKQSPPSTSSCRSQSGRRWHWRCCSTSRCAGGVSGARCISCPRSCRRQCLPWCSATFSRRTAGCSTGCWRSVASTARRGQRRRPGRCRC